MIRKHFFLLVVLLGVEYALAENTTLDLSSSVARPSVPVVQVSTPIVAPLNNIDTPAVSTSTASTGALLDAPVSAAPDVVSGGLQSTPCGSSTSPTDKWTISLSTTEHKLELLRVGTDEVKTVFEWHQASCESFGGWAPDEKQFTFTLGAPLSSTFVILDQKNIRVFENSQAVGPALYPFPSGAQSSFIDNRYVWLESFPSVKINRTDLVLKKSDPISEGRAFSVSPEGSQMVIDRVTELVFKDLVNGKEVVLDPLEKINQQPSSDWPRGQSSGGYVLGGWRSGGSRFWYYKDNAENKVVTVLINRGQVVMTNVNPVENPERVLDFENGWVAETFHLKVGEPGFFQTVKPEESILTVMGIVSGNIVEVARSQEQAFQPKFINENGQVFLEFTANGEKSQISALELRSKVAAAFHKQDTFVKSAVLKNLRK